MYVFYPIDREDDEPETWGFMVLLLNEQTGKYECLDDHIDAVSYRDAAKQAVYQYELPDGTYTLRVLEDFLCTGGLQCTIERAGRKLTVIDEQEFENQAGNDGEQI